MATTKNGSKYNAEFLKRASAWITERGLFPEPHGSTIRSFCKAMGISEDSHARWVDRYAEYAETIKKANKAFTSTLVLRLENSLMERATGLCVKKKTKTTMIADENGDPIVASKVVEEEQVPPDTTALIFALKNVSPEQWRDRQIHDLTSDGKSLDRVIEIVVNKK